MGLHSLHSYSDEGSAENGRLARLLCDCSTDCRGPRRITIGRRLHQLGEVHGQPQIRLCRPCLRSVGIVSGSAYSEFLAVSTGAGDGGGRGRSASGRDRRLGGYRGNPVAPVEELALTGGYPPSEIRGTCSTGAGSYATVRGRGDRGAELGGEWAVFAGS